MDHDLQKLLIDVKNSPNPKVKVAIVDIDGVLRGKYIHPDKFKCAAEKGFGFCNVIFGWDSADVCYQDSVYTGWHSGYPDALARIDLSTHRNVPWDNNVTFFLADFYLEDGQPLEICPRQVLKKVLAKAKKLGYEFNAGCEFEWFNFQESPESLQQKNYTNPTTLTPGMFGYSLLRAGLNRAYFNDLQDQFREFNVPIEGLHTETGPGVYEAALQVSNALEAADRAALFKSGAKEIAANHQIMASFMAKWNSQLPGCSGHVHLSMVQGAKNLFYSATAANNMSELFTHFLAGLLRYIPDFLCMLAPTVNSYKRLVKGFWAPTSATWGIDNRTCAFRVIPWGETSTRVETRVPGSDMNPYLSLAAIIGAGLLGIEEKLALSQQAVQGNGYEDTDATGFARNLQQAAELFAGSTAAKQLFGEKFVKHYSDSRLWEWQQSQAAVTDWELKRYFEII